MYLPSCVICGSTENLQKHHVLPLSRGGEDSFLNRVWICIDCHFKIHNCGVGTPRKTRPNNFQKRITKLMAVSEKTHSWLKKRIKTTYDDAVIELIVNYEKYDGRSKI